jgi:hypothetical protein
VTRPPLAIRIVGWFLLVTAASGFLGLVTNTNQSVGSVLWALANTALSLLLGWGLVRGHRAAYIPALLLFLAVAGWLFWFFFIHGSGRYSLAVRLVDGLIVLAFASLPLVALLRPSSRAWARGMEAPSRPEAARSKPLSP